MEMKIARLRLRRMAKTGRTFKERSGKSRKWSTTGINAAKVTILEKKWEKEKSITLIIRKASLKGDTSFASTFVSLASFLSMPFTQIFDSPPLLFLSLDRFP